MGAETIQTLDQLLRDLATQLGTTVENLWPMYVQNIYYIGLITVVSSLAGFLAAGISSWMFFKRGIRLHKVGNWNYDNFLVAGWVALAFGVLFLVLALGYFRYLIFPEGVALAKLIEGL